MNAVLFAFTARGRETARRIADILSGSGDSARVHVPERLAEGDCLPYAGSLPDFVGSVFDADALIFVGACGIAVRAIAPHAVSKRSDPAVLCVDERARYVIPILSGHIGGGNRLARRLSAALDAEPVITTATDVNGRFSVDAWAAERGMGISDMTLAKRISAEILTRDIPFWSDHARPSLPLPEGLAWNDSGLLGICVSARGLHPFEDTLLLTPRVLRVGIGCRLGTSVEAVAAAVERVFQENGLDLNAVADAASIDIKADEPGLVAFCRRMDWPLRCFSAAELAAVPGCFSRSEFVLRAVGVDSVCERAAAADGGDLIVRKTAFDGVTVAVAEQEWGIDFGQDSRGGHRARRL